MPKNLILASIKKSFSMIWKNKALFALLFVLQIIFFAVFVFITLTYQTKILESAKAITDYLSKQNLDEASVASSLLQKKNVLGDNPLMISRNFNEIIKNFRLYLVYAFALLVVFASINWTITNELIHKNNLKRLMKAFFRIFIVLLFYLGLIFLFLLFNVSLMHFGAESAKLLTKLVLLLVFSSILSYFMLISLSLSHNTELKNIAKKTFIIGIKKIHYILSVYFVNIFLFIAAAFLLFYFIEKSYLILLLSILLMIFSFVFGRIFMVNVVEGIGKN